MLEYVIVQPREEGYLVGFLAGIPSIYMSMFFPNLTFIEKLNKHRMRFFWAGKK
jgi:hypothetical protein